MLFRNLTMFLCLFVIGNLHAQEPVAESGCTFIEIRDIPDYPTVVTTSQVSTPPVIIRSTTPNFCRRRAPSATILLTRLTLQRRQSNGLWNDVEVAKGDDGYRFNNLSSGWYRIFVETPGFVENCTPNEQLQTQLFNFLGQFIGIWGAYQQGNNFEGFTNEAYVGPADNSDITFSFDNDEDIIGAYDLDDDILLNTSGRSTDKISRWKLYVWEAGNWRNRFESPFIRTGLPLIVNVNETINANPNVFTGGSWAGFEELKTYKFYIGVQACGSGWGSHQEQTFMCPSSLNCRPDARTVSLKITPNPVRDYFNLVGDDKRIGTASSTDQILIYSISGDLVIQHDRTMMDRIDVTGIKSGIYILKIISAEGEELFVEKFVKE
mgnify:CR=1 FL=1